MYYVCNTHKVEARDNSNITHADFLKNMPQDWKKDQPIYRQLRDQIAAQILSNDFKEGEALPSVRSIAVELQINPLTANKAYQELVDENLLEKRRGLGMYVKKGARERLLLAERKRFLEDDWTAIAKRMSLLGITLEELLKIKKNFRSKSS